MPTLNAFESKARVTRTAAKKAAVAAILAMLLMPGAAGAESFRGPVLSVESGTLVRVDREGEAVEVRLYGVASPAIDRPGGEAARDFTAGRLADNTVEVEIRERDRRGNILGWVTLEDGVAINEEILSSGYGWWDRSAAPDESGLGALQDTARAGSAGLWGSGSGFGAWMRRFFSSQSSSASEGGGISGAGILGGLILLAFVVGGATWAYRRSGDAGSTTKAKASDTTGSAAGPNPAEKRKLRADQKALQASKEVIQDLLRSLSTSIDSLVSEQATYADRMGDHKASIHRAMTKAGVEEIERLLVRELDEIQASGEAYRRELENANEKLREQQETIERIQIEAKVDYLTKVPNRRALEVRMGEELERSQRHGNLFSIILFDVDHFKGVNDEYGHLAGDKVLQVVAHVMKEQIRGSDGVYRYGGEEFALLLPETKLRQAKYAGDKIREAIERTTLSYEGREISVTISGGIACVAIGRDDFESLLGRADAALYRAKESGRNRIEVDEGAPPEPQAEIA